MRRSWCSAASGRNGSNQLQPQNRVRESGRGFLFSDGVKAAAEELDASGKAGADGEAGRWGEIVRLEAFADGEESVGAGETVAVDAGEEGESPIAPAAAAQVAENKAASAVAGGVIYKFFDRRVGEVMQKMIGEEVVEGLKGGEIQGVGLKNGESGNIAVARSGVVNGAGIGIDGGDVQIEVFAFGGPEQPNG